jgi:hypothetical protein
MKSTKEKSAKKDNFSDESRIRILRKRNPKVINAARGPIARRAQAIPGDSPIPIEIEGSPGNFAEICSENRPFGSCVRRAKNPDGHRFRSFRGIGIGRRDPF